jgi:hypothetical protein
VEDADLRLDGNALAGELGELFAFELTQARLRCDSCGAIAEVGAEPAYIQAPGAVVRCRSCDGVLLVLVRAAAGYRLSLTGATWIEVR